jgi:predicted ATPase/DNA-binding winged helix-turn-helix (wHTH) protein
VKEAPQSNATPAQVSRPDDTVYAFGGFRLVPKERKLFLADQPIHLGSRAFAILVALVERAGTVVPADELMRLVWPGIIVEEANLRVQLGSLRKVLARSEGGRGAIETVPLRGYCFVLPFVQSKARFATSERVDVEHNLPTALTPIVGRSDSIALLSKSLADHRLVTVLGPGGIGKTTVALAVARLSLASFADGVRFVDFSSLAEPRLVASALASTLGISVLSDDPVAGLLAHLHGKEMLILLDTCEHVVDAAALLAETLLTQLPGIRILATSREALRARGEWVYRLPSLSLAPVAIGLTAAQALTSPAVELFVQQATAGLDRFELSDADAPIVAEICRRLDGIPLAIELAAARTDELSLREIAERLHDRFSVLTRGRRTALPRHQTLAATLGWSHDLLSVDEQVMLRRLAVFRGPFIADAAIAVATDEPSDRRRGMDTLSNLFVKSLLTADVDGETVLYRMLDTTRAFAADKLAESEELKLISHRHAAYLCAALRDAESHWQIQNAKSWIAKYGHLIDDVRCALDWAMSPSGDQELFGLLTSLSATLWFALSLLEEYGRRLEAALAAGQSHAFGDPNIETGLLDALGRTLWHTRGDMPAMEACFAKALARASRDGNVAAQYRAYYGLIVYGATNGNYIEALETSEKLGKLAATIGDPNMLVTHRRLTAIAATFAGEHSSVRDHTQYVLNHPSSSSGTTRMRGMFFDQRISTRTMLARTLWQQGFPEQARDCAEEGLALGLSLEHALSVCLVLAHAVAPIALWSGDLDRAAQMTELLLGQSREHGFFIWRAFGRAYQTALEAESDKSKAKPMLPSVGALLFETVATLNEKLADDAILKRGEQGLGGWSTPELLRISAKRLLEPERTDPARAEALLLRSLDFARRQGALSWELRSAITLAELWQSQNRQGAALELLASVHDRFTEGFGTADLITSKLLLGRLRSSA